MFRRWGIIIVEHRIPVGTGALKRRSMRKPLILLIAFLTSGALLQADLLTNGGFETADGTPGVGTGPGTPATTLAAVATTPGATGLFASLPGWTVVGTNPVEIQNRGGVADAGTGGVLQVELDSGRSTHPGFFGYGYNVSIAQTFNTAGGVPHTLSFYYRGRTERDGIKPIPCPGPNRDADCGIRPQFPYIDGAGLTTNAMGVYLNGVQIALVDTSDTISGSVTHVGAKGTWTQITINLGTLGPGAYTLMFSGLGSADSFGALLDLVSVGGPPIPEPSTILLLGGGLAGLFFLRRRRQLS
jgi:hypothetical protein